MSEFEELAKGAVVASDMSKVINERLWLVEFDNGEPSKIVKAERKPTPSAIQLRREKDNFIPRSGEHFYIISKVGNRVQSQRFFNAVLIKGENGTEPVRRIDGKALRVIIKAGGEATKGGIGMSVHSIVWEGTIDVLMRYQAMKVNSGRQLERGEWVDTVRIRVTNKIGSERIEDIALMDTRQQQGKSTYIDRLGLATAGNLSALVAYIRIRTEEHSGSTIAVRNQGPIYRKDGTRVFISRSLVIDDTGRVIPPDEMFADLDEELPSGVRYYDVTPPDELKPDLITAGIDNYRRAYYEIPTMPEIPATYLAQNFTSPIATVDPRFFIASLLVGMKGSGKSYFASRYDAICSRTMRDVRRVNPAQNMGDATGTAKGPKYRVPFFGGFPITGSDLLQEGDPQRKITDASYIVGSLVRSFESGSGSLGRVNRKTNEVTSGESGRLAGNIRFDSEVTIPVGSTIDRIIDLPPITEGYATGPFDKSISNWDDGLSSPDAIEAMHHTQSDLTVWLFTNIHRLDKCYSDATRETKNWTTNSRINERYARVVAGHFIFQTYCKDRHDIDVKKEVTYAIAALKRCAMRQAGKTIPLAALFRSRIRLAIDAGKVSFVGRGVVNESDEIVRPYSNPFVKTAILSDADADTFAKRYSTTRPTYSDTADSQLIAEARPPHIDTVQQLGCNPGGEYAITVRSVTPHGYVIPPNAPGGRGHDYEYRWNLAMTSDQLERLCDELTRYSRDKDGYVFAPDTIRAMLQTENVGDKRRKRLYVDADSTDARNQQWVTMIDMEWLFSPTVEGEE